MASLPGDPRVNYVRIGSDTPGAFNITNGTAAGWTFDIDSEGNARFRAGSLAPGQSQQFTLTTGSAVPATDLAGDWLVEVSDNNGQQIVKQRPATVGALTTTIRVLSVDSVAPSAPAGVLDGTATANQTGVGYQSIVSNHGSAPLTVTPTLSSSGDSVTSSPSPTTINPGANQTFPFTVTLGNAGTRQFTADATASGADAVDLKSANLVIQPAAQFAYKANTLSPLASSSGVSRSFTLSVDKTNPPSVTFDYSQSVLTFSKLGLPSFSTTLASAPATGNGTQSVGLQFAPVTIPTPGGGDPTAYDGQWTPELTLKGTDDNGAAVSRTVSITNNFEIDNLIPVVLPTLSAPSGQVNPDNQPVVKDGNTLTFGGTIKKGPGAADPADPSATITACDLVVLSPALAEVSRTAVPLTVCKNTGGNITGSQAPASLGVPAGFVRLDVAAADGAGNGSGLTPSNLVAIDNVAPALTDATTGCGAAGRAASATCDDFSTIRVRLSEHTKGSDQLNAADFSVFDNIVVKADMRDSRSLAAPCTQAQFCDLAILTLGQAIGEDETPAVVYEFNALPTRTRPADGPKNNLADGALDTIDGIVPDLPSLGAVSQNGVDNSGSPVSEPVGKQGSSFYTNDATPTFSITGLGAGYTAIVSIDNNGNGNYDEGTDQVLTECESSGATADCDGSGISLDGTYNILISSTDADGNLSSGRSGTLAGKTGRPETLVLDRVAPAATGFSSVAATRTVSVAFDESVNRGRDFAEDWFVYTLVNGVRKRLVVGNVDGAGASRDIHIAETEDRWTGSASETKFSFNGLPSERYRDLAGNYLGDFDMLAP